MGKKTYTNQTVNIGKPLPHTPTAESSHSYRAMKIIWPFISCSSLLPASSLRVVWLSRSNKTKRFPQLRFFSLWPLGLLPLAPSSHLMLYPECLSSVWSHSGLFIYLCCSLNTSSISLVSLWLIILTFTQKQNLESIKPLSFKEQIYGSAS